jgi:hypothetical protein
MIEVDPRNSSRAKAFLPRGRMRDFTLNLVVMMSIAAVFSVRYELRETKE